MDNTNIKELNAFLKGEYMAIDSYDIFIQKANNQRIQQEHKLHALQISERIQNLGGRPVSGLSIIGKIAETVSNIKISNFKNDVEILVQA